MKRLILVVLFALLSREVSIQAQGDQIVSYVAQSSVNPCEFQITLNFQGLTANTVFQVFRNNVPFSQISTDYLGQDQIPINEYECNVFVYTVYLNGFPLSEVVDTSMYQTNQSIVYCPEQDSYLRIGQFARVPLANPSRTKIRLSAGITSPEVRTPIAQGRKVLVVEGPVCLDGITWWRVVYDYGEVSQVTGWMAETDGDTYYLEPVVGEYAQIVYPTLPNYSSATTLPWMTINTLIHSEPSLLRGQVAGRVHLNEVATVLGQNGSGTWLQVYMPETEVTGWVCSQLVFSNINVYPVNITDNSSEICEILE